MPNSAGSVPVWAYPGNPVAVLIPNNSGDVARRATVGKVTGQVVQVTFNDRDGVGALTQKFTRDSSGQWLQSPRSRSVWDFNAELVKGDDPRVAQVEAEMDRRRRRSDAIVAAGKYARHPSKDTALAALNALQAFLEGDDE